MLPDFHSSAVGPFNKVLQFSISDNPHHDSYGIFWCGCILSHSSFQGRTLYDLVMPSLSSIFPSLGLLLSAIIFFMIKRVFGKKKSVEKFYVIDSP